MTQPVFTREGQRLEVDEAEAARGFQEGRYGLPPGPVRVRFSDGGYGTVDASEAHQLLAGGGALATQEEIDAATERAAYSGGSQQAIAGLEGAARGATFGLSDVAINAAGGEGAARLRRQYNPGTALAGELGGAVLPMLIPGAGEANVARIAAEGGALARAGEAALGVGRAIAAPGRAVEAVGGLGATGGRLAAEAMGLGAQSGVLGRAGAAALEGAGRGITEGAIQGLGGAVSEVALGETPDIRADRLLLHVGMGALFGTGAGGALGAGGSLARSVGRGFPGMGSAAIARNTAQTELEAAGIYGAGALKKLDARARTLNPDGDVITGQQQMARLLDEYGIGTGGGMAGRLGLRTPGQARIDAEKVLERARGMFRDIDAQIAERATAAEVGGFRDAAVHGAERVGRVDVRPVIAAAEREAALMRRAPMGGAERAEGLLRKVEPLREHVDDGLPFADAHRQERDLSQEVRDWGKAQGQAGASQGAPSQDMLKLLRGQFAHELDASAKRAGLGPAWRKANEGYSVARAVLDAPGTYKSELGGIGGAVNTGVNLSDLAGAGGLGAAGGMLLGVPGAIAGSLGGRIVAQEIRRYAPAVKARVFRWLMKANQKTANAVREAAEGATATRAQRVVRSGIPRATIAVYEAAIRDMDAMTPQALAKRLGDRTSELEAFPEMRSAVIARGVRAQAFLEAHRPPGDTMRTGEMQPHLRGSRPVSESERARFIATKRAVDDPQTVLDAIQNQTVTPEQVEALHDVYPELYNEVRRETMKTISTMTEPLSYQARIRLGVLLNAPTDPTLQPDVVAALQLGYAPAVPAAGPQPPNKPGRAPLSGQFVASEVDAFEQRRALPVG